MARDLLRDFLGGDLMAGDILARDLFAGIRVNLYLFVQINFEIWNKITGKTDYIVLITN